MDKHPGLIVLKPVLHNNLWGGRRLANFGYELPDGPVGECWGISAHPHGDCVVDGGVFDGIHLSELWLEHHELFQGAEGDRFPLLIKVLDALQDLSIQVHPDDAYAAEHENGSLGKHECWYILDCHEHAHIIVGQHAQNREEFARMVEEGRWDDLVNLVPIQPGDFFDIAPGTLHAIMGATLVLETQQSSDITYRVYDYDRPQADGTLRELHLAQAMDVIDYTARPASGTVSAPEVDGVTTLVENDDYGVMRVRVHHDAPVTLAQPHPFLCLTVVDGTCTVETPTGRWDLRKGTHAVAPFASGDLRLCGEATLICSFVPTAEA